MKTQLMAILKNLPPKERKEILDDLRTVISLVACEEKQFSSRNLLEARANLDLSSRSFLEN